MFNWKRRPMPPSKNAQLSKDLVEYKVALDEPLFV